MDDKELGGIINSEEILREENIPKLLYSPATTHPKSKVPTTAPHAP